MFKDTIRVIQSGNRRIKIFIDFWNVMINARGQCQNFDVHVRWDHLVDSIVSHTRRDYSDETLGELAGCYIFGSRSASNPEETKFIKRVLDQYGSRPGLFFNFADRVLKKTGATCTKCGEQVKTKSESGVDVLLTVEMIKHASMREQEYLAIVSSDRDFMPLLSFLKDQGHRVLHVASGNADVEMRALTWAQVDLRDQYSQLCTIEHEDYIILTAPPYTEELKQIQNASPVPADKMRVIDITDKSQITDKDLVFLMSSLGLFWTSSSNNNHLHNYRQLSRDLDDFRLKVATGTLGGNIPCVIKNGTRQVYFNGRYSSYPWIIMAGDDAEKDWKKLHEKL